MAWAGAQRKWMGPGLLAALLMGAAAGARSAEPLPQAGPNPASGKIREIAAGATGSIAGRLTDLHSTPLAGATVVVRNAVTEVEARTVTAKNGSYRFDGLAAGEYTLDADSAQLGHGRLEGIYVSGGHEARVQAAMTFEPAEAVRPVELASHESVPAVAQPGAPPTALPALPATAPAKRPDVSASIPAVVAKERPAAVASLPALLNPLQELAQRRAAAETREKPETAAAVVEEPLALETPRNLTLSGRALPARLMPSTTATVLIASLASEPLLTMSMSGHREAAATSSLDGPSVGGVPAVSAAMPSAGQAAPGFVQAPGGRVEEVARQQGPTTPVVATTVSAAELQSLPAAGS